MNYDKQDLKGERYLARGGKEYGPVGIEFREAAWIPERLCHLIWFGLPGFLKGLKLANLSLRTVPAQSLRAHADGILSVG